MSSEPSSPRQVTFTPEFKRNLRQLAKKYRHIKSDLQPIIDQLASGSKPGDQVPQVRYEIFKVRAKNSDSKTEQADIAPEDIRHIILDLETAPDAAPEQPVHGAETDSSADQPGD
jgi:mRNA-degrading endonuclease RelE of RelBE toxin-antitoxin system